MELMESKIMSPEQQSFHTVNMFSAWLTHRDSGADLWMQYQADDCILEMLMHAL